MARLDPKSIVINTNYRSKDWQKDEARQLEAAGARAKARNPGDTVGELLKWPRADGNAVYMVTSERPLRIAHVDVGDAWNVEGALIRGLNLRTVRGMVERERKMRHFFEHANDFFKELEVGSIVHYHNAFGEFVRCEVVLAPDDDACAHANKGEPCLKPLALVGSWRKHELGANGYHRRMIREESLFVPSAGNIYENPKFSDRRGQDPRQLAPLEVAGQQELFA